MDKWDSWLWRIDKTAFSLVHCVNRTKRLTNRRKFSLVIHSQGCTAPTQPGDAFASITFLNFYLGNIRKGGTLLPLAFTASVSVINIPLSAEVTAPTCFVNLIVMIFDAAVQSLILFYLYYEDLI